jgi:uncharacterized protein (TIGR02466 family)
MKKHQKQEDDNKPRFTANVDFWFPVDMFICEAPEILPDVRKIFDAANFSDADYKESYNGIEHGVTTYSSGIAIPVIEETSFFLEFLVNACQLFAQKQGVNLTTHKIEVVDIWLNRLCEQGRHAKHAHGGRHYSGTFYVNIPEKAGALRFYNPHADLMTLAALPIAVDGDKATSVYVDYIPVAGRLLIWNSWVYHEVITHPSKEFRDTISFNYMVLPR